MTKPLVLLLIPALLPLVFDNKTVAQTPSRKPFTLALECAGGDCPLLKGAPETAGMRSGFVRLQPGQSVGWHSTGNHEESLVILQGQGDALAEGHSSLSFRGPQLVYIPPATRHNVTNTGNSVLEYVYVVAPAAL
jgi:mannose-6-phosphate isomerase-like protein (cupin superfamily)